MNVNFPNEVELLPLTRKEKEHHGRNRLAYHVFISYYYHQYNLHQHSKRSCSSSSSSRSSRSSSSSTTSSSSSSTIEASEVRRQASTKWRSLSSDMKGAWKDRANLLNARPRNDGLFEQLPTPLNTSNLESFVLKTLTSEWLHLVKIFKNMCTRRRSGANDKRVVTYVFGNEKVEVGSQVYRSFYISPLMLHTIFGLPLFSSLALYEKAYENNHIICINIYSHRRISDLLKYGGMSAASFLHSQSITRYTICAKANLKDSNGRNVIGYIVDESENEFEIKLKGLKDEMNGDKDMIVKVKRPQYNKNDGYYVFDNIVCDHDRDTVTVGQIEMFSLSQIWPTRIKINKRTGASSIICNIIIIMMRACCVLHS